MKHTTAEKLERIQSLLAQKQEIELELERLLSPETVVALPPGFEMNREIEDAVRGKQDGILADEIYAKISEKWKVQIDRRKMNSALIYLVNRKRVLERVGRAKYRIVSQAS